MTSAEVQRTLVKSPPELWTELSDPQSLARHLGEFGEIRITRVEPEQTVEWEGETASGSVLIKPSGWGTRVTLTVNGELAARSAPAEGPAGEPTNQAPGAGPSGAQAPDAEPDAHVSHAGPSAAEPDAHGPHAGPSAAEPAPGGPPEPVPAPEDQAGAADDPGPGLAAWAQAHEPPLELRPPAASHAARAPLGREASGAEQASVALEPPIDQEEPGEAELAYEPYEPPLDDGGADTPPHAGTPHRALPRRGFFAWLLRRGRGVEDPPGDGVDYATGPGCDEDLPYEDDSGYAMEPPEATAAAGGDPTSAPPSDEGHASPGLDGGNDWVSEGHIPGEQPLALAEAPPSQPARQADPDLACESTPDIAAGTDAGEAPPPPEDDETERVRTALTSVLDRLGAAHHRPFSRP